MRLLPLLCATLVLLGAAGAARADERMPCSPGRDAAGCVAQPPARLIDLHDRRAVADALRQGVWIAGIQPPPGPISPAGLEAYLARIFWTGAS